MYCSNQIGNTGRSTCTAVILSDRFLAKEIHAVFQTVGSAILSSKLYSVEEVVKDENGEEVGH